MRPHDDVRVSLELLKPAHTPHPFCFYDSEGLIRELSCYGTF